VNRAVSSTRHLALAGVVFGLIAALAAFGWGGVKTVLIVIRLAHGELDGMAVSLVGIIDAFLIAAGLLIFALGLYEVFVGELEVPQWLVFRDFDALKGKLAGIIVMVLAVTFLERLESGSDGRDILQAGAGIALVSAVLVWMSKKS
jgi:uncharacterized protein (TIGR00645 family)